MRPATVTSAAFGAGCHHDHLVEVYETDGVLVGSVVDFFVPTLRAGGAAILAATPEHRAAVTAGLQAARIDVRAAARDGRFVTVDAAATLASLMVDGSPDPDLFHAAIVPLIETAGVDGREVRIYGELVALLLASGDVASTIAVEDLWNDLASRHRFALLCGYPAPALEAVGPASADRIHERHSAIVASTRFAPLSEVLEQQRLVARLREEETALRAELERLRREQKDLIDLAYHDPVTGLANRRSFDHELAREWALAARDGRDSFVVIADLDDFKYLNDTFGHAAGDAALRRFGDALRRAARTTDVLARIGGDEFGILLVRCDERAVHAFRQRLGEVLAEQADARLPQLGVSLGHASLRHSDAPATALDRADLAMLALKRARHRRRRGRTSPA
ncbi:MAG TPA: diguanylate cyclase [Solirubrobacteraceae bacterium]|nr:diguanylate cyclase [Solirubrobacteraceae bacterium]